MQDAANEMPMIVRAGPENGVTTVTLSRPASRNALSLDMLRALISEFEALSVDENTKVIVLSAEGPVFCAGHDLRELTARRDDADRGRAFYDLTMRTCAQMMLSIVRCPKPVIAAVQGTATAAGCQLVATCDLAVAANTAKFCTPGVNIGLFCSTPMVALSRNVPRKRAMEMLLLGELIAADQAVEFGLLNRSVTPDRLTDEVRDIANRIASKSAVTVAIGKRAFYDQLERNLDDAYDFAADVMTRNMMERDAAEGIGAFLEKREPRWTQ